MGLTRQEIQTIASEYNPDEIHVGFVGSHSALELGMAAKAHGMPTVVILEKGRDKVYRRNSHLYDKMIAVDSFKDIMAPEFQEQLIEDNVVFVPNRSFSVYNKDLGAENEYGPIENDFKVPMYGNRNMLRAEDRNDALGQYAILESAGIRTPEEFKTPDKIDRLAIVKIQQAGNELERAFFYATSPEEYDIESQMLLEKGVIDEAGLENARIEEYILGARFNANFHYYGIEDIFGDFDFVGLSDRRQVNLQGFLNLTAKEQLKLPEIPVKNEEIGHFGVTVRESKQELFYNAAEQLYNAQLLSEIYSPGMLGCAGIQGAIRYSPEDEKTLEFVVFDLSPRIPGDPAMGPTSPEMRNLTLKYGRHIDDPLDLTIMEIQRAVELGRLQEIVT